jgi:hypothetical protein
MKKAIFLLTAFIFIPASLLSQDLSDGNFFLYKKSSSAETGNTILLGSILLISPSLVLEDSKAYFGLSKEISAGIYPYGRAELDYTYIFRSTYTSTLNISYNLDIPLNGKFNDPSLFFISPGGGYYTDFTRHSAFIQASLGLFAGTGFSSGVSVHPNIKFRKVFRRDSYPGSFEISLGVGFAVYSR